MQRRERAMLTPTKILVPTDFSGYSDRALGQALDIAKEYRSKVFLLHVVHGNVYGVRLDFIIPDEVMQKINDDIVAWAKKSLQNQLNHFTRAKEVEVATNVRQGIPYDEILKEEKEKGIDLIVIASLGRTGMAKYLIGGVARNVLKGSTCPVLLTK
jgi:universal stress protein A